MQNGRDELRTHASLEAENKLAKETLNAMVSDLYMQLVSAYQERKAAENKIKRATTAINALSGYKDAITPALTQMAKDLLTQSDRPSDRLANPQKDSGLIKPR